MVGGLIKMNEKMLNPANFSLPNGHEQRRLLYTWVCIVCVCIFCVYLPFIICLLQSASNGFEHVGGLRVTTSQQLFQQNKRRRRRTTTTLAMRDDGVSVSITHTHNTRFLCVHGTQMKNIKEKSGYHGVAPIKKPNHKDTHNSICFFSSIYFLLSECVCCVNMEELVRTLRMHSRQPVNLD